MKMTLATLVAAFLLPLSTFANQNSFNKILIIGASASADHSAPSPGKLFAEQANIPEENVYIHAKSGSKMEYHRQWVAENLDKIQPDMIIAFDLFFHDFKFKTNFTDKDRANIDYFIERFLAVGQDVIVGNIVQFTPLGGARGANKYLNELAAKNDRLHIFQLHNLYMDLISFKGHHYTVNGDDFWVKKSDVLVDIIHPNLYGSQLMTNIIIDHLLTVHPDIPKKSLPYIKVEAPQRSDEELGWEQEQMDFETELEEYLNSHDM